MLDIRFTWTWIAWGLAFAVIEGIALYRSAPGDTLSEHVWVWLGIGKETPEEILERAQGHKGHRSVRFPGTAVRIRRIILISFFPWLILHFTTGWV